MNYEEDIGYIIIPENIESLAVAIAISFMISAQFRHKSPREALSIIGVQLPKDVVNDWNLLDFRKIAQITVNRKGRKVISNNKPIASWTVVKEMEQDD